MALVFTIDFEEGDLTDFDSLANEEDLAANATAAMVGSYGMEVTLDDTSGHYGIKNVTISTNDIRYRFYFDPTDATLSDNDAGGLDGVRCDGTWAGETEHSRVDYQYTIANGFQIQVVFQDDESTSNRTTWTEVSDTEHYIEVLCSRESSDGVDDGVGKLFIDGVETGGSFSNLGNYGMFQTINEYWIGITHGQDVGTTGSWYIDDIIFRDDDTEIGSADIALEINIAPDNIDSYTQGVRVK